METTDGLWMQMATNTASKGWEASKQSTRVRIDSNVKDVVKYFDRTEL
jgi:hypothetical protein